MASNIYGATALTGGAAGALDELDGTDLAEGDICIVAIKGSGTYFYVLDATVGGTESSPTKITPDTNAGDKRWLLQPGTFTGITEV